MQRVWDDKQRVFTPFALRPWTMPAQQYSATVVALAQQADWLLFDLGDCQINAVAKLAAANAYLVCRLNPQATRLDAVAGRVSPVALASRLATVKSPLLEQPIVIGAKEPVAARLLAARVPEDGVHARRRRARKNAKKRG